MFWWALIHSFHFLPEVFLSINQSPLPPRAPPDISRLQNLWFPNQLGGLSRSSFITWRQLTMLASKMSSFSAFGPSEINVAFLPSQNFGFRLQQTQTCPFSQVLEIVYTAGIARGGWKLGSGTTSGQVETTSGEQADSLEEPWCNLILFSVYFTFPAYTMTYNTYNADEIHYSIETAGFVS